MTTRYEEKALWSRGIRGATVRRAVPWFFGDIATHVVGFGLAIPPVHRAVMPARCRHADTQVITPVDESGSSVVR